MSFPATIDGHGPRLDAIDPRRGGASRAHVDALKLLAVFMQHTDTKADNQRLICLDPGRSAGDLPFVCSRPFMLLHDVGLTFGAANFRNANEQAMSLARWAASPIWKEGPECVGHLPQSFTGTLGDPSVSEEGRVFLAKLLLNLSDAQIRDLFAAARVHLRLRDPDDPDSDLATADDCVNGGHRRPAMRPLAV